jgi:predicted ATPase
VALTEAELLYTRGLPPQATYLFKHALTQEVAYRSLLTARCRELHHRVAVTLETLFPDRLEEISGQLAHHYLEAARGGDTVAKAIAHAVRAGQRNMALPAYAEAARFYHLALEALERQASVDEEQRYTLLLALGEAQRKAGEHVQALETLQRAATSARQAGSAADLARVAWEFEQATWLGALSAAPVVPLLEEVLRALGEEASVLRAQVLGSLGESVAVQRRTGAGGSIRTAGSRGGPARGGSECPGLQPASSSPFSI